MGAGNHAQSQRPLPSLRQIGHGGRHHRVAALADRPAGVKPAQTHPFYNLIPLPEILGEVYGSGAASKRYSRLMIRC
ncbi:MAG: hypothetical protein U0401_25910 [Anaerolineae bacterium]